MSLQQIGQVNSSGMSRGRLEGWGGGEVAWDWDEVGMVEGGSPAVVRAFLGDSK